MRLVKQDIQNIDAYLQEKGIKYIDIRYELIDHLVSEYEAMENYPDLESFLLKRVAWCRKIAEEKRKSIHWGYQKALRTRVFSFFKEPFFYACIFLWIGLLFLIFRIVDIKQFKYLLLGALFFCVAIQLLFFFPKQFYKRGGKKNLLSFNYLFNIYAIPHLFLHFLSIINLFGSVRSNKWFWIFYVSISVIVNIAAIIEVQNKRKSVLEQYDFLKIYLK
mgnify:CR=1 FL=1